MRKRKVKVRSHIHDMGKRTPFDHNNNFDLDPPSEGEMEQFEDESKAACVEGLRKSLPASELHRHVALIDPVPAWESGYTNWTTALSDAMKRPAVKAINALLEEDPYLSQVRQDMPVYFFDLNVSDDVYLKAKFAPNIMLTRYEGEETTASVSYSVVQLQLWIDGVSYPAKVGSVLSEMTQNWLEVFDPYKKPLPFDHSYVEQAAKALNFHSGYTYGPGSLAEAMIEISARMRPSESCMQCGRRLTDPISRVLYYGPTCARQVHFPHDHKTARAVLARRHELNQ